MPTSLPPLVSDFLAAALELDSGRIQLIWSAFSDLAEAAHNTSAQPHLDDIFRLHSHTHSTGAEPLLPPISCCLHCQSNLGEEKTVEGRLYSLHRGVLPIFSKSLYCRSCHIRYYNNYFVRDASQETAHREYYSQEVPKFIHLTESTYVEPALCQFFTFQMALEHGTCQGIARVYNLTLGSSDLPNASRLSHDLTGELVLDSFILYALLQDKQLQRETLVLPHHGYQNHRFDQAMAERNARMVGTGQHMWAHACNRCMKVYKGEDGNWYRITAGVHDGVDVRHVSCGVHECQEAVPTQRHHFCVTHSNQDKICCVIGCNEPARPNFRTCTIESHVAFQAQQDEKNTAMFQLRARLKNTTISDVPRAGSQSEPTPLPAEFSSATAEPLNTNIKVKGKLARSWTHNEQLFVRCCGIILSRATMFGSEGVSGVKNFLKATFPPQYPGALPSYIFYDNNCSFLKHLRTCDDHYFENVGLPVDVFHFKCKHSEADVFCQIHCNPARFRELIDADGKWVFNSSAAEQANVWFGKFQSVVQDMPIIKYNFFLDEMISVHNEHVAAELRDQGHAP
ncbi:hypothetical protein B0H13DRAFT_2571333, partial [Mycena leptocephala]